MATSPIFIADVDTLKAKLRLSGVPTGTDAEVLVDEAILTVRAAFYRELGETRIAALAALPFVEDPTTEDEVLRATANLTEVRWVRAELMGIMPVLFMDSSADQTQVYQDEAAFRDLGASQVDMERQRLLDQVWSDMELLRGSSDPGSDNRNTIVGTIEPPEGRPEPGGSIRPQGRWW